jgi:ABC-type glycerol-3-phosphate transport system permease component
MSFRGTVINPDRFHHSQIKFYLVLIPVAIFMILPIVYIVNQAFKPLDELFLFPPRLFVQKPTMENFQMLMRTGSGTSVPMSRYLFNSIFITAVTVFLNLAFSVSAGYALSKRKFKSRSMLFKINQFALMFVPVAVVIPRYLVLVNLNVINTYWAHILPMLAMPVSLFLVKQFIDQVPDSLIEAARIDGAGDFSILYRVVVPLIKPALATVAILTFQAMWNNIEASNYWVSDETLKTFVFYLSTLTQQQQGTASATIAGVGMAAAAGLILFIPNLIIFVFMQSRVMNTMSHSGMK